MKTRRIKIKTRKSRKIKGGKVSKFNGMWDFDLRNGRVMSTIQRVLDYQGLEIEVLNDLAGPTSASTETNSNTYLETSHLEDEFQRRCDVATAAEYDELKKLKSKISEIIHLRTEEGSDKFDPFEDAVKKRKREGHEFRVNLWSKKYTIIKKALNVVRRKLHQDPDTDTVFLMAQLGTLGKKKQFIDLELKKVVVNIAHMEEDFDKLIKDLNSLLELLRDFTEQTTQFKAFVASSIGLQTYLAEVVEKASGLQFIFGTATRKVEEVRLTVDTLNFKYQDPLFLAFYEGLSNFSSKTPEQVTELFTLFDGFISYLKGGTSKEIHTTREQVIRGILASINQEEQALQSDLIENEKEEAEPVSGVVAPLASKDEADPASKDEADTASKVVAPPASKVPPPKGVTPPVFDLAAAATTRKVKYIEVLDAIMNELEKAPYIDQLKELIERTISRTDIEDIDKTTLVFYMRALLFSNAIDILTIVAHLSVHDSDYLRKPLSAFYAIEDTVLQPIIKKYRPDETTEGLLQSVTKNMCDGITNILICFYVFMYYLYQYLHLSPPNLEALPKIAKFDDIKRRIGEFEQLKPVYLKDILQIFSEYRVFIKAHSTFFKQKFKGKITDTFLMKELMDSEREKLEGVQKGVAEKRALYEHVKKLNGIKRSLDITTKENKSNEELLFETHEKVSAMERTVHPDTRSKIQEMKRIIFSSELPKDDQTAQKELEEIIQSETDLSALKDDLITISLLTDKLKESERIMKVNGAELGKMEKELLKLPGYSEKVALEYTIKELGREIERIIESYPAEIKTTVRERLEIAEEMQTIRNKIKSEGGDTHQSPELNIIAEKLKVIAGQLKGVDMIELDWNVREVRKANEKLLKLTGGKRPRKKTRRAKR